MTRYWLSQLIVRGGSYILSRLSSLVSLLVVLFQKPLLVRSPDGFILLASQIIEPAYKEMGPLAKTSTVSDTFLVFVWPRGPGIEVYSSIPPGPRTWENYTSQVPARKCRL